MLKKTAILLALSFWLVSGLGQSNSLAAEGITAHLTPEAVDIGTFFNGTKVYVSGDVSRDSEVVVRVSGMLQDVALKKKGKILGLLWMNLGSITIHNVPNLYLVYVSKDLEYFARTEPEKWKELGLDFAALEKEIDMSAAPAERKAIFKEFLKLKESEGLYAAKGDGLRYGETESGLRSFQAVLQIPPRLTPGTYSVETFAIKDGSVAASTHADLQVKQVGLPALISALAFKRSVLYGVLATIIAVAAGLLMGVVFKGEKGAH